MPVVLCLAATTLIGLGTRPHNAIRSRLTLARIPASVIIGLATLLTLHPDWWTSTNGSTWVRVTAIAMLLGAAIAYQAHELRGHGVTGGRLVGRTVGIVAIGLCYAFIICYATLRVIAPLMTEDGEILAGWWLPDPSAYQGAAPWWLLGMATAWSYTVGVFVQVVWDDRPITAPWDECHAAASERYSKLRLSEGRPPSVPLGQRSKRISPIVRMPSDDSLLDLVTQREIHSYALVIGRGSRTSGSSSDT